MSIKKKKWIFIYGPGRTGSTYLLRLIRKVAKCSVSDWGLGSILKPFTSMPGGIDKEKFLQDLAKNLLESSRRNDVGQLDLVIKSASGNAEEFECYQKMFGPAQRVIFTIREPSGYMASAIRKFSDHNIEDLQISYLTMLSLYQCIGGEIFDYKSKLKTENYLNFLSPLNFESEGLEIFEFKGKKADDLVTEEMNSAYEILLRENQRFIFKI
tara:strand:+ start:8942 stop:9577 length:636 start_codon:yes stop_codon:yes gene_type:complete